MAGTADALRTAVDAVVQQDLSWLSLDQLQEQVTLVAGQVQRLSGFTGLAMARLHTRTGGELPTEEGRSRSVAGWAADATRESASTTGRLIRTAAAMDASGDAESVLTALEPLARPQGLSDTRSAAQRRADALVDVCEQVLRHGELPDAGGQRPQLSYVVPADWAARRTGEQACPDCSRCWQHQPPTFAGLVAAGLPTRPTDARGQSGLGASGRPAVAAENACATAAWTGPQTRSRIEALLCDARISRVLLDSARQVKGLESLTNDVTAAQRRVLAARDLGCVARGCTRPPALCDAHHLVRRAQGGPTALSNLVLLCRRHHVLWHLGKIGLRDLRIPWLTGRLAAPPPPPATTGRPDPPARAASHPAPSEVSLFDVVAVS